MSIEDDLRRALWTQDGTQGWPDPVRRVEAGIRRRRHRRRVAVGVGLVVLLGLAAPTVFLATGGPSGNGSVVTPASPAQPLRGLDPHALLIAGLLAMAGLWFAHRPIRTRTIERFRQCHGLVQPAGATVTTYLATRRQWRVVAITAALIAELLSSPTGRVEMGFAVLAGALLAGALAAEVRFRLPRPTTTAGPRQPVPGLLTATLAGALALAVGTAVGIPRLGQVTPDATSVWAAAAAGAILTTAAGIRLIASRPSWQPGISDEARTIATHGMHSLTAHGVAASLLCTAQALRVASDQMLNKTALAIGSLAWIWVLAAFALAIALSRAGFRHATATRWSGPSAQIAAVAVVTLSVSAGLLVHGKLADRPPFDVSAVNPRATVIVSDFDHYAAAAAALGTSGGTLPEIVVELPVIYGKVDVDTPPDACDECYYYVVLIDEVTNVPTINMFGQDGATWGQPMYSVPRQYPWLSALTADNGMAAFAPVNRPGPIVFTAFFHPDVSVSADRLVVALILAGPDEIYWATRVPVTPLALPT